MEGLPISLYHMCIVGALVHCYSSLQTWAVSALSPHLIHSLVILRAFRTDEYKYLQKVSISRCMKVFLAISSVRFALSQRGVMEASVWIVRSTTQFKLNQ